MKNQWTYNLNGSEIWAGDQFDTREEAIIAGREQVVEEQEEAFCNDSFIIGQCEVVSPSGVDVDFILENVAENTTDEVGEVGEDYLNDVISKHSEELEEKLNEVLFAWMKKYKYEPTFFQIKNAEKIELIETVSFDD
ncbi:hypothetical protein [Clostridium sp.]|uniref:hypothetical protein n=1 Tax=Clostridium sp. TaxID=1506 RepID=UPI001A420CEF|nr:hypothetical protein [Clostridium sp.]MBK5242158.1 hypothetical protein [Clostridium sp.]